MANIVVDNADPNAVFGVGSSTPAQKPTPAPTANPGLVEDPADPSKVFSSTPVHKSSTGIVADNANPNDVFGHEYTPPSYSANAPTYEKSMLNDVGTCTGRECGEEISHYLPQSATSLDQPQNFVQPDSHGNYPEGTIMHVAPDPDRGRFDKGHYFEIHYKGGIPFRLESNVVGPDEVSDSRPLSQSDIDAATRGGVVHAYMPRSTKVPTGQQTVNNPSTDSSLDSAANNVPPNLFAGGTSGQFTPAQLADLQKNFTPAQVKQFVSMKQQEGLIGNVVPMAGAKVEGLEDQHAIQNQLQYEHDQNVKRAQQDQPTTATFPNNNPEATTLNAPSTVAKSTPTIWDRLKATGWNVLKDFGHVADVLENPEAAIMPNDPEHAQIASEGNALKSSPTFQGGLNVIAGAASSPVAMLQPLGANLVKTAKHFGLPVGDDVMNQANNAPNLSQILQGAVPPAVKDYLTNRTREGVDPRNYAAQLAFFQAHPGYQPRATADPVMAQWVSNYVKQNANKPVPANIKSQLQPIPIGRNIGNEALDNTPAFLANSAMALLPFLHIGLGAITDALPKSSIPESLPATDVIDSSLGAKASTPARNGMTPKASMPKSTISEGLSTAADQFTEQAKQVQDPEAAQALNAVASTLNDASVAAKPFDDEPAKAAQAGSAIIKQNPQVTYLAHKISGLSDHDAMLATWGGEEPAKATVTPPTQDYSPTNKIPATPIEGTETQPQGQAQPIPPPVAENATAPPPIQSGEEVPGAHMRTPVPEPTPSVAPSGNWGSFNPNKVQTTPEGLAQIRGAAERGGWLDKTPFTDEEAIKQASQIPYDADMLRKLTPGQIPDGIPAKTWAVYVSQADAHFGEGAADAAAVMRDAIDTNKANPTPENQSAEDAARSAYEKAQQDLDIAHAHDQRVPNELGTGLQGHKIVVFNRRNAATSAALQNAPSLQDIGSKLPVEAPTPNEPATEPMPVKPPKANSGTSKPKLITDEVRQASRDALKNMGLRLNAGLDPTALYHLGVLGAGYIEDGIRAFPAWKAKMIDDIKSISGKTPSFKDSDWQRIYAKGYASLRATTAAAQRTILKPLIMDQHTGHFGSRLNAAKFVDAIADADANNPNPGRSNTILDNYMHGHPMDEYQKNVIADADAKFAKTTRPAPTNNALATTNNIVKEGMKAAVKEKSQAAQLAMMEAAADKAAGDKLKNAAEQAQRIADRKAVQAKLAQDRADANKANKEAAQLAKQAAIDAQKAAKDAQSAMDSARNESIKADQREQARQDKLDKQPIKEGLEADQKTRAAQQRFNTAQVKADAKGSPLSNMGAKVAARDAADARVDRSINSRTVKSTFDRFGTRSDGASKVRADLASTGDSGIIDKLKTGEQLTNEEGRRFAQAIDAYKKTAPTPGGNDISSAISKTIRDAHSGKLGYDDFKSAVRANFEKNHPTTKGHPDAEVNQARLGAFNRALALIPDNDAHAIGNAFTAHNNDLGDNVAASPLINILSGLTTPIKVSELHVLGMTGEELHRLATDPKAAIPGIGAGFKGIGKAIYDPSNPAPNPFDRSTALNTFRHGPVTSALKGEDPLHEVGAPLPREFSSYGSMNKTPGGPLGSAGRMIMRREGTIYHILQSYAKERHLYNNALALAKSKGLAGDALHKEVASLQMSPPTDLLHKSIQDAKEEVQTNDNKISKWLNEGANKGGPVAKVVKSAVFPVTKIVLNSAARALEMETGLWSHIPLTRKFIREHPNATPAEITAFRNKIIGRGAVGLGIKAAGFATQQLNGGKGPDQKHYEYGHVKIGKYDVSTADKGNVGTMFNEGMTYGDLYKDRKNLPFNSVPNALASSAKIAGRIGQSWMNNPFVNASELLSNITGTDEKPLNRAIASVGAEFTPYSAAFRNLGQYNDQYQRQKSTIGDYYRGDVGLDGPLAQKTFGIPALPPRMDRDTGNPYLRPNILGATPSISKSAQAHSDQMNAVSDILASEKGNYTEAENNSYNAANYLRAQARAGVSMDGPNGLQVQADRLHKANVLSLQDMITFKEHPNEPPSAAAAFRLGSLGQLVDAYPKLASVTSPADMADFKKSVKLSYVRYAEKGADPDRSKYDALVKLGAFAP